MLHQIQFDLDDVLDRTMSAFGQLGLRRVRPALEVVLARAQAQGDLPEQLLAGAAATQTYAVMSGLAALQQTGTSQDLIESTPGFDPINRSSETHG
jgi:hypothetical protein